MDFFLSSFFLEKKQFVFSNVKIKLFALLSALTSFNRIFEEKMFLICHEQSKQVYPEDEKEIAPKKSIHLPFKLMMPNCHG